MNHPQRIEKYNWTINELWEDIGNLDYDVLVQLFEALTLKFAKDSVHDSELKHPQVAQKLFNISIWLKTILEDEMRPLADKCREYNQKWIK